MRKRERGIGNMPFIALLVLLVVAIALFFVKQSDLSKAEERNRVLAAQNVKVTDIIADAGAAYDQWLDLSGLGMKELRRTGDMGGEIYPAPKLIKDTVTAWMMAQVTDIAQKSQAKIKARQYQVDKATNTIRVQETGDTTTITLFGSPFVQETITWQGFVAPLGEQFRYAAKAIEDNNGQFETEYKSYETRVADLQKRINETATQFQSDVTAKAQLFDTEKTRADTMQDQVNTSTASIDALNGKIQQMQTSFTKDVRTKDRENSALKNRIQADKAKMEIALKEDPKDGEVLVADQKQGIVFLDLGKNFRVAPNMKFRVWRIGKGNVREDIAEVEVIDVGESKSTARIVKQINPRVPAAPGMSFSSPFYDPHKKLHVNIYGNLRYYPSDLAKRRLAESGCVVSERLDDTVDVIVLGEPSVDLGAEAGTPEEAAANEEKAKVQRAARIREVMDLAATLGAVVVTEDVLQTFIQY